MAYHEPRNSKVAKLRSCNRGFHNVFDFSAFLSHNAPSIARQLIPSLFSSFSFLFQEKKILYMDTHSTTVVTAMFCFLFCPISTAKKSFLYCAATQLVLPGLCKVSLKLQSSHFNVIKVNYIYYRVYILSNNLNLKLFNSSNSDRTKFHSIRI